MACENFLTGLSVSWDVNILTVSFVAPAVYPHYYFIFIASALRTTSQLTTNTIIDRKSCSCSSIDLWRICIRQKCEVRNGRESLKCNMCSQRSHKTFHLSHYIFVTNIVIFNCFAVMRVPWHHPQSIKSSKRERQRSRRKCIKYYVQHICYHSLVSNSLFNFPFSRVLLMQ